MTKTSILNSLDLESVARWSGGIELLYISVPDDVTVRAYLRKAFPDYPLDDLARSGTSPDQGKDSYISGLLEFWIAGVVLHGNDVSILKSQEDIKIFREVEASLGVLVYLGSNEGDALVIDLSRHDGTVLEKAVLLERLLLGAASMDLDYTWDGPGINDDYQMGATVETTPSLNEMFLGLEQIGFTGTRHRIAKVLNGVFPKVSLKTSVPGSLSQVLKRRFTTPWHDELVFHEDLDLEIAISVFRGPGDKAYAVEIDLSQVYRKKKVEIVKSILDHCTANRVPTTLVHL